MPNRKVVGLSMQPEDVQLLEKHAEAVGLTKSDLVRRLLYKLDADDKLRALITTPKYATLYNAHSVNRPKKSDENGEKKDPGDQSGEDSSSLDPTGIITEINLTIQQAMEIDRAVNFYEE